ncbi:PTS transporter subunit EIIC [Lapidilactobacillus gannanensis]|uniref:Permease IIC component n=1 Tax=Lapidilactobacillus gannanensis TaxID=2486002 RepID=A0ABW4BLP9_9LACO|nr:PTS transporter subunit EIIC [Lapidilactobacillus gannanensis]MCH4057197.1 PTS transporter subunit EIIC [Lactobacillaceae bacterium]
MARLVKILTRMKGYSFFQIIQRTLVILFPFALLGAFAQVISTSFLSVGGFFGSIFEINAWLPHYQALRVLFDDLSQLTLGMLTIAGAFEAAKYTAKHYQKDDQMAGLTAAICYGLIFFHRMKGNTVTIEMRYYDYHWLLVGILVGYLVGRIFKRHGMDAQEPQPQNDLILSRAFGALKPIFVAVFWALVLHAVFGLVRYYRIDSYVLNTIQNFTNQPSSFMFTMTSALLTTVLAWFGFAGPLAFSTKVVETEVWDNLSYALSHGSSWKIPHPYSASSLYHSFGTFGGTGVLLALVIAMIVASHSRNSRIVSQWSLFPAIFNTNFPVMIGIPVLLNPLYLIPFTLMPLFNMAVASLFIWLKVMPPVAYPVPSGTPGPLVPFIGTNGNIMALVVAAFILILDVLLYLPFIRLTENVDQVTDQEGALAHEAN